MKDKTLNGITKMTVGKVATQRLKTDGILTFQKTTATVPATNVLTVGSSFVEVAPATGTTISVQYIYLSNYSLYDVSQGTIIHLIGAPGTTISFVVGGNLDMNGVARQIQDDMVADFIFNGFEWVFMSGTACQIM